MSNQISTLSMSKKFKKTPVGDIPVEWGVKELGSVVELINGHGFKPSDWKLSGVPIVRIQNLNGGSIFNYYDGPIESDWAVESGDLLFAWSGSKGTSFGPFLWDGPKAVLNQHIFNVKVKDALDKQFLYQLLKKVTADIEYKAHGSAGLVHVTKKELAKFAIPLPELIEQRKVAEILSSVDDAIQKTGAVIEKTKELKRCAVYVLFLATRNGEKSKKTKIGPIPHTWDIKECETLCEEITVGIVDQPARLYTDTGIPCLRSLNLEPDNINEENLVFISPESNQMHSKSMLRSGDVVVVRTGYPGTAAVVRDKYEGANCIDLVLVRPHKGIQSSYLSRFFNSPIGQQQFLNLSGELAQQHLNVGAIKKCLVPVPPVDEQNRITQILQSFDLEIERETLVKKYLASLKQALMQMLLTGKVRV